MIQFYFFNNIYLYLFGKFTTGYCNNLYFRFWCYIFSLVFFCIEESLCNGVWRGSMGESEKIVGQICLSEIKTRAVVGQRLNLEGEVEEGRNGCLQRTKKGQLGRKGTGSWRRNKLGSLKSEEAVARNEGGYSGYAVVYKNRGWSIEDANRTQLVTISECR